MLFFGLCGGGKEQMQQQASLIFYRYQHFFVGTFVLAFLILVAALITAVGANTPLDGKTHPTSSNPSIVLSDSSNVVTDGLSRFVSDSQHALLVAGTALYSACHSVTSSAAHAAQVVAHAGAAAVRGTGHGIGYALHAIGDGVLLALNTPKKFAGTLVQTHVVSSIIQPSYDKPVPVISNETSAAALASLTAAQQKVIARLQAAQVAANRGLGGVPVAGDPHHGGYPARWDAPVGQDSQLDSWGMYNRECVSYAAWKVYQTFGSMPYWGGKGNANQLIGDARRAGIPTGTTPRVHSVAILMSGYYGHAMWVEAVSGPMIYVSQYNYDLRGHYSEMWVNSSSFTYIYFR